MLDHSHQNLGIIWKFSCFFSILSFMFYLDITKILFFGILQRYTNFLIWVLWACLATRNKNENNLMFICMSKINFIILLSAFEIQVLSTLAIMCRGSFRIFQFALAIRLQKNCQRPTVCYISNGVGIHWHIAKGYDLVF